MSHYKIAVLALMMLLAGCATHGVISNSTAFYKEGYAARGKILVAAAEAEVNSTLEFAAYKQKFEAKLAANGYQIVNDPEQAEYIALVAYGIDEGKSSRVTTPIYGQTGGGPSYYSGTTTGADGVVSYSGSGYRMPTYGVVGSTTHTATTYNRAIALDIITAQSFRTRPVVKVYEGRTRSQGDCAIIVEVFDEMLEALFAGFPGENGRNRVLKVPADVNCR